MPWKSKFCRGKVSFAVEKYVLPWKSMFCREKVSFAVADVGHRNKQLSQLNPKKACGSDEIRTEVLKEASQLISH